MQILARLAAAASIILCSAFPALAEFSFGGDVTFELDREYASGSLITSDVNVRGEVVAGYDTGTIFVGGGLRFRGTTDNLDITEDDLFLIVGYGPATLSYGSMYGAGNIVTEDYFLWNDATGFTDDNLRLDLNFDNIQLAVSHGLNDADSLELGLATEIAGNMLRVGYEVGTQDLFMLTGRDLGQWGYHFGALFDLDDGGFGNQIGGTVLYDINDHTTVAANLAYSPGNGLHSYGVIGWYELDYAKVFGQHPLSLRAEYSVREADDTSTFELSLNVPFGQTPPASYQRAANKEVFRGFGFTSD